MRKSLLIMMAVMLASAAAAAEQPRPQKADRAATSCRLLPLKRSNSANACAEYGAGFVKIEGTNTCMKIGGAVSVGAGVSGGSR
jgi:porin-like protein